MSLLVNFLLCSVLLYSASYCLYIPPIENQVFRYQTPYTRLAESGLRHICMKARQEVLSRKFICIICKGISCFHTTSTTTTNTPYITTASNQPVTTPHVTTTTNPATTTAVAKKPTPPEEALPEE